MAVFTGAARILLYFSGSSKFYVTVFCHHGVSNGWNNVVCAFHSSGVLFWIISLSYFQLIYSSDGGRCRPLDPLYDRSARASACGPTNSVYNGGLLGEAAELAGWYVNVIPPPTTTLPKVKMKLTHRTAHRFQSSTRPGVVPLVPARLPHPSAILLRHLGVLTTCVTTFLSHRRPARPTSTRPLRRHGALLHCRPTINHRILPRLQMILHR